MTLRLNGDSSGFTEIKAADTAGDNSIKLPASNGSANQLLQNGGTAGELQYTSAGGGLHYDSSGRLLVGASSARSNIYNNLSGVANQFQIEGTGYTDSAMLIVRNSDNANDGGIVIGKTRGTTVGSNTVVQDNDSLGEISFQGADGSGLVSAVEIKAEVDGTPSNDVMPAKLVFSTNAGSSSPTPRMEIGSNGALKLLSGCPGIDFSGIQTNAAGMTSETLDSYEEGTWSPTITAWNGSYTIQNGTYVKIGKMVFCQGEVITNGSTGNSMDSYPGVDSLPFVPGVDISGGSGNVSQRHMGTGTIIGQNASLPTGEIAFVTFDKATGASLFPNNISNTQAKNFAVSYITTTNDFGYRFNLAYYTNA